MTFWLSLLPDELTAVEQQLRENLEPALASTRFYGRDFDTVLGALSDQFIQFAEGALAPASFVYLRQQLRGVPNYHRDILGRLATCPWKFKREGLGLLNAAMFASLYEQSTTFQGDAENDLNAVIASHIVPQLRLVLASLGPHRKLASDLNGPKVFFAPTTNHERLTGSDTLLLAHIVEGPKTFFRGTLIQGKVVDQINGLTSVKRGPTGWEQLDRIVNSQMGYYCFFQHQTKTKTGVPVVPITVRSAEEVYRDVTAARNFKVSSFKNAMDFPTFFHTVLLNPDPAKGLTFATGEEALEAVRTNVNLNAVLVVSEAGGFGYNKLLRFATDEPRFGDPDEFSIDDYTASQQEDDEADWTEDHEIGSDGDIPSTGETPATDEPKPF